MSGRSPRQIALLAALLCALLITIVLYIINSFLPQPVPWYGPLAALPLWFLICLLIYYKALQLFIYDKIKLIFRNIHSLNVEREAFRFDMNSDILGEVNKQVVNWAEDRMAEIKNLREQENFRKEFVGNVAHELKTPIFSIQGYILTLLEGALEDPNFNRKFLMKAARSVERMTRIVEDLDTITQFEAGNLKLNYDRVELVELTREVMEAQEMEAEKKKISLKLQKPGDKPLYVRCDSFRISQVITNLIANSINYGNENGQTTVRIFDMEDNYLVEVEDNGPGIAREHLPRLFERFYRVDKSRSRNAGGTGLGLAIVKHIIEAHKQSINVRSEPGKGSTFSFTLKKAK